MQHTLKKQQNEKINIEKNKNDRQTYTHTHNLSTARKKTLDIYTYALNIYNNAGTIQNYKARNKIHTNGKCRLS